MRQVLLTVQKKPEELQRLKRFAGQVRKLRFAGFVPARQKLAAEVRPEESSPEYAGLADVLAVEEQFEAEAGQT